MNKPVTVKPADDRFVLLSDGANGYLSGTDFDTDFETDLADHCLWQVAEGGCYVNYVSGSELNSTQDLTVLPGPDAPLTELAATFRQQGWVCLPNILDAETVTALQRVALNGFIPGVSARFGAMLEDVAVARTIAEPVSLWLTREYLQTRDIRLAHTPTLTVIGQDDGQRDVQGWHSDFPYLWGITDAIPQQPADFVLGVQRNVCITDFTEANGATVFALGSHTRNCAPPHEWGLQSAYGESGYRAQYGLPYEQSEARVIEAPAGSILLYDARTWHRQGVNQTAELRAAMLQAMTPAYIAPFFDTAAEYKALLAKSFYPLLSSREQRELANLLVHTVHGRSGPRALGEDVELTRLYREDQKDQKDPQVTQTQE